MTSKTKAKAPSTPKPGHGVEEFRAEFDRSFIVPQRIREAI
jgi:hypothetical protein